MADANGLLGALKKALKLRDLTYAEVGKHLGVSESTVKRWFSEGNLTLKRINELCGLLDMDFQDLTQLSLMEDRMLDHLSEVQEQELVSDMRLLLVGYLVLQHWNPDQILARYDLDQLGLTRLLARLDRLKLIELQPGNKVKPLVAPNFAWIPGGPIQRFFEARVRRDFFESRFEETGEIQRFLYGELSDESIEHMNRRILRLIDEYNAMLHHDRMMSPAQRHGTSLVLALRRWDFTGFEPLKRPDA